MNLVKNYQCPGCMSGEYPKCFKKSQYNSSCSEHKAGSIMYFGSFFLGMPKGFNRIGVCETKIEIYEIFDETQLDIFNVPVWKYLDEFGNTLVRGLRPRKNEPFLQIIKGDVRDKINCLEITDDNIKEMD